MLRISDTGGMAVYGRQIGCTYDQVIQALIIVWVKKYYMHESDSHLIGMGRNEEKGS